jgi:hypothetical protein
MAGKKHSGLKASTKGDPMPAKKKVLPSANVKPGSGKASTRKPKTHRTDHHAPRKGK